VVVGVGIGVAQAIFPTALRLRFPDRETVAVAVLAAAINGGAIMASALSAPMATAFSSWRTSLAVWALPALAAAALWAMVSRRLAFPAARRTRRSVMGGVASMGLVAGAVSYSYFVVIAWLVSRLVAAGVSVSAAGLVLAAVSAVQIPAALGTGVVMRGRNVTTPFPLWLCLTGVAMAGIGLAGSPLSVAFALLVGIGNGILFTLCLLLPLRVAADADEATHLSATTFGIGYLIASIGPILTGLAHGWTDSFAPGFCVAGGLLFAAALVARRWSSSASVGAFAPL
jgi:CP family cyanate transporter-like MFS transporter